METFPKDPFETVKPRIVNFMRIPNSFRMLYKASLLIELYVFLMIEGNGCKILISAHLNYIKSHILFEAITTKCNFAG